MRLIHTSDWHLGRRLFDQDLLPAQQAFLDWLLEQARIQEVAAVIVAGDIYDRAVPPLEAVALLDRTFTEFARARIPLLVTAGNHDSAVRLGFGSGLSAAAGIHLRTRVSDIVDPLVLTDEHGEVALYGIPYLLPDAVMGELAAERSHTSVLVAALDRVRADAAIRGIDRVVVAAHAFVTGATESESERDIRVGGIGDVSASIFDGLTYVALGHLHGRQPVSSPAGSTAVSGSTVVYSGSPMAFSFSERHQAKSVELVDIDGEGAVTTQRLAAPVPRPLREVRGHLADLIARAGTDLADCRDAWVKAVLTDPARPSAPLEQLRQVWPHTLVLGFAPDGGLVDPDDDLARLAQITDPVQICAQFVTYVGGSEPDPAQLQVLRDSVEAATHHNAEVGA